MSQNSLQKYIKILIEKLTIIENSRLVYKQLIELCGVGKQFECVIKKSNCFWSLTIKSISFLIITELAKIYDEQKDSIGIRKIINISSQNKNWFSKWCEEYGISQNEFISRLEMRYFDIKDKREKLKEIRDKELAHNDKYNLFNQESICAGFTWGDIEDLIETAYTIINEISVSLSGCEYMIKFSNYDDINNLIKNAYKGMNNVDKLN
ncbi:MAG: hypothetical protein IJX79_02115 [Clostridia bacterium]|nr:hypothetical protein [Clostridia bacterium]